MSNVPVLQAVRAADAFRRLHWRAMAPVLGAVAATGAVVQALSFMNMTAGPWPLFNLAVFVAAHGALLRLAFADEHPADPEFIPGRGGLQFRRPELRITAVWVLQGFLLALALLILIFVGMLVVVGAGFVTVENTQAMDAAKWASLSPQVKTAIIAVVSFAALGAAFVGVRLSLSAAASVSRKQILIFQTWALTRGQFWRIALANLLIAMPGLAAWGLMTGFMRLVGAPGAAAPAPIAIVAGAVLGLVAGFVSLPLGVGLMAFLYRGLRPAAEPRGSGV